MNEELIKLFRTQLGRKQYAELEGTWLELISTDTPLPELLALTELAVRWAPVELPVTLLWVLAEFLAEQRRFSDELVVLRRLVSLTPDDEKLTRALVRCLHDLYPELGLLDRLIQKSGLGYGVPLAEALERFDRYLRLLPGKMVYDQEHGIGTVRNLDLLFDRVQVAFDNGAGLTLEITAAVNRFRFPGPDSFFYLLKQDPDRLRALAQTEPAELVARYLRDTGRPATAEELTTALAPVIGADAFPEFWERARKGLTRHPHIAVSPRTPRRYQWQAEPRTKPELKPDQQPEAPERRTGITPEQIRELNREQVLKSFQELRTAPERRKLLDLIYEQRPADWQELYSEIFLAGTDSRTCQLIQERLPEEKWQELVKTALTDYRRFPDALLVLAQLTVSIPARQLLNRLLDIMELDPERSRRNQARKILTAEDYRLVRSALTEMEEEDARRLRDRIKASRTLEPFQQDELLTLIAEQFPALTQKPAADAVWTTAAGLERAKRQLQELTQVELPKSAEEIARARAFGDLSENYEYKAAKEKQARLMQKISQLQQELSRARVIEPEQIDTGTVSVGCRVELTGDDGTVHHYSILGPWDADHEHGIISFQSPLARKLLGRKPGELIQLDNRTLKITAITRAI
ncbi:MAG: transcription elongation factor GreA [candidate division WOR-3 bacterium]